MAVQRKISPLICEVEEVRLSLVVFGRGIKFVGKVTVRKRHKRESKREICCRQIPTLRRTESIKSSALKPIKK